MTFNIRRDDDREFKATVAAGVREAFGPRVEDRYEDRGVCVNVRAVRDGRIVLESPSDIDVTREPKAALPTLPSGVHRLCDPGVQAPTVEKDVKPRYPIDAMREQREGTIVMRAVVGADGRIADVVVVDGLSRSLDGAAVTALKDWRFKPGTRDGIPVSTVVRIELSFWLR